MWRALPLIVLAGIFTPELAEAQRDTLEAIDRVNRQLRYHYGTSPRGGLMAGGRLETDLDKYCDGGSGSLCHGGDPDRGYCPKDVPCHPTEEFLVEVLLKAATENPGSGYVMGQAVYALTKFGYQEEASNLVHACEAEGWWCNALRGYLLHSRGLVREAEALFREAMRRAPAPVMCLHGDAMWLLGEWDQRTGHVDALPQARDETSDWSCVERLLASDTIWWWADPLYNVEGNDRWTEHMARAMSARFAAEIRRAIRGSEVPSRYVDYDWAMRIRRGAWDSFEVPPGGASMRFWTSKEKALYHFLPEVKPDDLSNPTWSLQGTLQKEGFTPDYGPLYLLPVQLARFRVEDSLRIAAAGGLLASPLRRASGATAYFILTDGPESMPLRLVEEVRRTNPVFIGEAPARDYVAGFEVMTGIGIGWDRRLVSPLQSQGPELSDLLLFDPSERSEPDSLLEVAATMLGSTTIERGNRIGVFWETYDAPQGATLEFVLTLEGDPGRLVDRLTAFFSGGSQEGRGRVMWTEPATGGTHPRSVALDLTDLEEGDYTLVLRVQWPGQPPIERTRSLTIGG